MKREIERKETIVKLNNGKNKKFAVARETIGNTWFWVTGPRGGVSSLQKADDGSGWYLVDTSGKSYSCTWEIIEENY